MGWSCGVLQTLARSRPSLAAAACDRLQQRRGWVCPRHPLGLGLRLRLARGEINAVNVRDQRHNKPPVQQQQQLMSHLGTDRATRRRRRRRAIGPQRQQTCPQTLPESEGQSEAARQGLLPVANPWPSPGRL